MQFNWITLDSFGTFHCYAFFYSEGYIWVFLMPSPFWQTAPLWTVRKQRSWTRHRLFPRRSFHPALPRSSPSAVCGVALSWKYTRQKNLQKPFSLHGKTNWFCLHQQQVQNHYSVQLSQTRPLFHCNVRGRLKILFHHLTDWPCVFHCPLQTHLETAAFLGTLFCFFFVTSEYGVKSLRTMTAFNPKHWQAQYDDKRLATLWVCKTLVQMIKWVVLREDSYSMN